jgi:hypothetical protein
VRGGCLYSSNFPLDYDLLEACSFRSNANGTLQVEAFNTEEQYDTLTVGGVRYSGRSGPNAVAVSAGDVISWYSDRLTVSSGFEVKEGRLGASMGG